MSPSSELIGRARELVAARLSPGSVAHCERVAQTAVVLARRFGVEEADAELAGLLHDYARDEDDGSMLAAAECMGIPLTAFEREHPYLIHARLGAALVRRDLPGVGEAVLSAVEVHTVGALPMSDLDRVVYLADMTEPGRAYEGVEDVRAACATCTLAECFRVGYGRSVRHILDRGRPLHPISTAVGAEIERETGRALFDPPVVAS